MKERDNRTV